MRLLGLDLGGSSARAVLCDEQGRLLGQGRAAGANPRSAMGDPAGNIAGAVRQALGGGQAPDAVAVGAAGTGSARRAEVVAIIDDGLARAGVEARAIVQTDLDIAFRAAAPSSDGRLLLAGTGAAAVRYQGWRQIRRADGLGWLLGDAGSGAWIGREVLRRVAASLEGRGPSTTMAVPVLEHLGIRPCDDDLTQRMVRATDGTRAAEWARLAPVALRYEKDPVAAEILDAAARALVSTAQTVGEGATVLAGGLLADGALRRRIEVRLGACVHAQHPVVGACALAAEAVGVALERAALTAALDAHGRACAGQPLSPSMS